MLVDLFESYDDARTCKRHLPKNRKPFSQFPHLNVDKSEVEIYGLKTCECVSKTRFYSEERDTDFENLSGDNGKKSP